MIEPQAQDVCGDECEKVLRDEMAEKGVKVTVSTMAPLVRGPYTEDGFICPHGLTYWLEPTGEQIAEWISTGMP
jgi:hypothetical protein